MGTLGDIVFVTIVTIVIIATIVTFQLIPAAEALVGAHSAPRSLVAQLTLEAGRGRGCLVWGGPPLLRREVGAGGRVDHCLA